MLSSGTDTIENDINIQIVLLIAILVLLLISVGYFVVNKLLHWIKIRKGKNQQPKNINPKVEPKSDIEKFLKILPNVSKELEKLQSYKSKADDFDELKNNFGKLEKQNETILKEKSELQTQLSDKKTELANQKTEFLQKIQTKENEINANKALLEKVRKAEILKDYAVKVADYIDFIDIILKSTNEIINKSDQETAKIMSVLLQEAFQKTTGMAKWKQICSDIIEIGIATQNKDLKNCFQSDKEAERLNAFKKLCISKMKPLTNTVLILCEANSNLSKFLENANVSSIENEFKNKITDIKSRAKEIGITEIVQVKLFTHLGNKEAIDGTISFPYSSVKNLNKDDITEIVEFGMKTEFEEQTKTKVLIN